MNNGGSWEGIRNTSPAGSGCCVYDLLWKPESSLMMLNSSWLSSLCEAITIPKTPKHQVSSASARLSVHAQTLLLSGWTTDYRCETEAMMITVHVHLRIGAFLVRFESDTVKPPSSSAWQVQAVWVFWILSGGIGQDITPSDPTHCPLPTGKTLDFLSLTHCWQVPLTAMWSPGEAVMANRVPPASWTRLY